MKAHICVNSVLNAKSREKNSGEKHSGEEGERGVERGYMIFICLLQCLILQD